RCRTLRGVYYGTTWSLDWDNESKRSLVGAHIRNAGFLTYTGAMPADSRPAFAGTSLLRDLKDSQSMRDGTRSVDIGHLLIGVETRAGPTRALPFAQQGGTGLEIVTWLGDLGGGAANLARQRASAPSKSVEWVFHNNSSDYGVTDNLEGDIAAYVVASGGTAGGVPKFSGTVADAVNEYLKPKSSLWLNRARLFVTAIGGTVDRKGTVTNSAKLVSALTDKLYDFGVWYAATRWVPSGQLAGSAALHTCTHIRGAANEIATVFVRTLEQAIIKAPANVVAGPPYPTPTPPGTCQSTLLKAAASTIKIPSLGW
ncbi:hypothetical protein IRY61_05185, partial [Candidatus Saccharibacteria bacterium]|nr:hypothetical protein [Candidatus Saccharibacteria bacterium]